MADAGGLMTQALFYSRREHSKAINATLVVLLLIDTAGTMASFANLWQCRWLRQEGGVRRSGERQADGVLSNADGITHWGDDDFMRNQYW